jgi:hypothetical protein
MIKLQKIIVTWLFLLPGFQIGFGQQSSEIELMDKFGRVSNDELLSRFDPFIKPLMKQTQWVTYSFIQVRTNR